MTTRVAVLLATYQGERFLPEMLDSLIAQTHADWVLYWHDDGSSDRTAAIMQDFADRTGRVVWVTGLARRLGAARSFLHLLAAATRDAPDAFAFADQDDVWLPQKLARGVAALDAVVVDIPALYCARQILVDAGLRRIGVSPPIRRTPGFPAALTQNIAAGCTILLNRAGASLVAKSRAPGETVHDWWCYLVLTAAGGKVLADAESVILYRQHGANTIGAPEGFLVRAQAALRRGPAAFMRIFRAHVAALSAQPQLLSAAPRADLARLALALSGSRLDRMRALFLPGLYRQTALETLLFRLWFLLG